jgi:hypothetical protein
MTGCKTVSTPATVKPTPPRVDCIQADPEGYSRPPRSNQWVSYTPQLNGPGIARLSQKAADWVIEVQAAFARLKATRKNEHKCLNNLVDKGVISK